MNAPTGGMHERPYGATRMNVSTSGLHERPYGGMRERPYLRGGTPLRAETHERFYEG